MPKNFIYQRQCPEVQALFNKAGQLDNILIVALDYAKLSFACLLCNGQGKRLLKPFDLHNDLDGFEFLLQRIATSCKRHGINTSNVLIAGEDCPYYAENFLWKLQQNDYLVVRVNAWKAKKQRENLQASSDHLDLLGIAKTVLNREVELVFPFTQKTISSDPEVEKLRQQRQKGFLHHDSIKLLGRTRDALVEAKTALSNRIHNHVKVLFPGFLDSKVKLENTSQNNPISPFGTVCLGLMEKSDFSAITYARKKSETLAKQIKKLGGRDPLIKAEGVIARARQVLPPRAEIVPFHQQCLQQLILSYRYFEQRSNQLEALQAKSLAWTPAAMLTSIQGIGIVNAAGIGGELGHVERLGPVPNLVSYTGLVPSLEQTGGPDKAPKVGHKKLRCNRRLKCYVVRAVERMGQLNGSVEFRSDYNKLKDNGQDATCIMAKRLFRTCKMLMKNQICYLPPELLSKELHQDGDRFREKFLEYQEQRWPKLVAKWKAQGALEEAFDPESPLGFWREFMQKLYGIELPLDGKAPRMKAEK